MTVHPIQKPVIKVNIFYFYKYYYNIDLMNQNIILKKNVYSTSKHVHTFHKEQKGFI